jgi:CubicO group peptidase (beta-lactamase class C family)
MRAAARLGTLAFLAALVACTPIAAQEVGGKHAKKAGNEDTSADESDLESDEEWEEQEEREERGTSCAPTIDPPIDSSALDPFFEDKLAAIHGGGMSVAVLGDGRIKWAKGYGFANVAARKPVTPDTLFMLASVSKTVTGVALMKLIEDPANGIRLDDPIQSKLPFPVRNPRHPSIPITYRMLLTHTSSLIDSDFYWALAPTPSHAGDHPTSLIDFGRNYVARADSWASAAPGTERTYSNTAISLAGLLVEQISSKNLQDYSRASIFRPLGMNESSWFLRGLNPSHIAIPYDGLEVTPLQHYGYPDYPAGQLRTSAPQLARFLLMFAGQGTCGSARILSPETALEMRRSQLGPNVSSDSPQGLVWYYEKKGGHTALGHNGADAGVSTDMFFDPTTGKGYVLLTSSSANTEGDESEWAALDALNDKLMQLAHTL